MAYCENLEQQETVLAGRFEAAKSYLKKLSDAADAARKKSWSPPKGISSEEYRKYTVPFRVNVRKMLGYPPPGKILKAEQPALKKIGRDEDGTFYRVNLPLLKEGYQAYGLLIRPPNATASLRKPLAVAIHGGGGTPEMAAGILGPSNYKDMGRRMARRGHTVWLPACYERTTFKTPQSIDIHRILDRRARLVGTTLSAIDAFGIIKSTETLLASEEFVGKEAIVLGLSYGGFRALLASALSDIFTVCISSCYFNDRRPELERYSAEGTFADWFFDNLLNVATDVELCRLICPRPLFIEVGNKDKTFPVAGARKAASEVRKTYRSLNLENLFGFDAFAGGHEFSGVKAFEFLDRLERRTSEKKIQK